MSLPDVHAWLDARAVTDSRERGAFMRELASRGITKGVLVSNLQAGRQHDAIANCRWRLPVFAACREDPMAIVVASMDGQPLLCQRRKAESSEPIEPRDRLQYSLLKACIGIAGRSAKLAGYPSVRLDIYLDEGWLQSLRDPGLGAHRKLATFAAQGMRVAVQNGVIPYTHLVPAYGNKARPILRSRLRLVLPDHEAIRELMLPCTPEDAGATSAFAAPG